jgi:hypothetical protein
MRTKLFEGYALGKATAASAAAVASVLLGISLGASSALAAACATAPVSDYMASGFSCSVGPVTFSNINVTTSTGGSGTVTLTDFLPFTLVYNGATEYGLELIYGSNTGFSGGTADVGWTYDVSGVTSLIDAYAALAGGVTGADAAVTLSEVLSNGSTLSLTGPGVTSTTFSPVEALLHVIKDQQDFAAPGSTAFSSIVANGFSDGPAIPESSTWAMLMLGFAGLGFAAFRRAKAYPVFMA